MPAEKKALVVFGESKYNMHVYAAQKAADILQKSGYTVVYVNTLATEDHNILQYFMQNEHPDYVVTFDCSGFDLELLGDDLFFNSLCCPMAHVLLSSPLDYIEFLGKRMNFVMDFYMQYDSEIEFVKEYFPRVPEVKKYDFCTGSTVDSNVLRDIDILIPSTYCPHELIMEQINQLPDVFSGICNKLATECINKPGSDVFKLLPAILRDIGFNASKEDIVSLMSLVVPVLNYVKMYFVDKIVRNLLSCGLCVTVCGEGWENFISSDNKLLNNLGPVAFADLPELMKRTLVVINNQAHKSGGVHERVWMALDNGASCITDSAPQKAADSIYVYTNVYEIPNIVKKVLKKD